MKILVKYTKKAKPVCSLMKFCGLLSHIIKYLLLSHYKNYASQETNAHNNWTELKSVNISLLTFAYEFKEYSFP